MTPDHDCLDYLEPRSADWTEPHGLDCGPYEHGADEWYHCSECGSDYTVEEVRKMYERDEGALLASSRLR
jgi:hypothetical protein